MDVTLCYSQGSILEKHKETQNNKNNLKLNVIALTMKLNQPNLHLGKM